MAALLAEHVHDYSNYTPSHTKQTSHNEILSVDSELRVSQTSWVSTLIKKVPFEPVYVTEVNGEGQLVYNSNMMESGKKYPVTWNGERFVLIKTGSEVSIYKFYPEKQ